MNSLVIAANIIRRAFKNRKELLLLTVLPIAAIVIITFINGTPKLQKANTGIVNFDTGVYSQKMITHMEGFNYINITKVDSQNYKNAIKYGKASFVIVIPEGFSKEIEAGDKTNIELLCSDGKSVTEKLKSDINMYMMELYMMNNSASDISKIRNINNVEAFNIIYDAVEKNKLSVKYDIAGKSTDEASVMRLLQSVGFSIMFIMLSIFNTLGTIIDDKKKLIMARMFTCPVREKDIVVGNLIGSVILGTFQLLPVVVVLAVVFKIYSIRDIVGIFVILLSFMVSTVGLGIGISGLIKNDYDPALIIAAVIFPGCLIGGCLIPQSMLPSFMTPISYAVPQKWVLTAINQLMTGAGFQSIMFSIGIILLFGIAFSTFGVKILKPTNE